MTARTNVPAVPPPDPEPAPPRTPLLPERTDFLEGDSPAAARALIAEYAADPVRLEDLSGRITAFRLSCCFERLKRSGRFGDVLIDDPFDPEGAVCWSS